MKESVAFVWSLFSQKPASDDCKSTQHHRRKPRKTGTYSKLPYIAKIGSSHSSPVTPTSTNRANTLFQGFLRQRISFVKPVLGTILGTILIFLQNAHFRGFVRIPQNQPFGAELRVDTFCDYLCSADCFEVHIYASCPEHRIRPPSPIRTKKRVFKRFNSFRDFTKAVLLMYLFVK